MIVIARVITAQSIITNWNKSLYVTIGTSSFLNLGSWHNRPFSSLGKYIILSKDRYVSVSWSFYDLEQKLIYKAKQKQSTVIKVDPRYTSQCCPVCGHIEKGNRTKKIHLFTCKNCGYKSNDDRIGAMNLYRMGINYLEDCQVPDTVTAE